MSARGLADTLLDRGTSPSVDVEPEHRAADSGERPTAALSDHAAIRAACEDGVGLCTIVGIDGSFSRRTGAQLAIHPDGRTIGSLANGCLERQLALDLLSARRAGNAEVRRYGKGSATIDFRLPCGGGLDILLDPSPPVNECRRVVRALDGRATAHLDLGSAAAPGKGWIRERKFIPSLRMVVFGEGPEIDALQTLAGVMEIAGSFIRPHSPSHRIGLGGSPSEPPPDGFSAVVLLFHDHEWEAPLLDWSLAGSPFYIGAQGGDGARQARRERMQRGGGGQACGLSQPVGLIPHTRDPAVMALSVLSQVVSEYEKIHPHAP